MRLRCIFFPVPREVGMLQSITSAAAAISKTPARKRMRKAELLSTTTAAGTPRAPRRGKAADEPGIAKAGVLLVTIREACALLKVSRMTLHTLIITGQLNVMRFGKAVSIPVSDRRRLATP